jgi:carboxypeptidase PM20D1
MVTIQGRLPAAVAALLLTVGSTASSSTPAPARLQPASAPPTAVSGVAARLAGAVRIPTVSQQGGRPADGKAFHRLHAYLADAFPAVHATLDREVVGGQSLLYTWKGEDASLKPILLMGHLDVVPIEPGTEGRWTYPPFEGLVVDGFIWGRGAIDNKSAVVGQLEAIETLLTEGFRPARTVYLAYGHDEEVGGAHGARAIAEMLKRRGVELEMVLDEGGVIGDGVLPGVSRPVALIGVAEKGFVSIELTVRQAGGHSSMPPAHSAIGILSAAIARLEASPFPARLEGPTEQLFDRIGSQFPIAQRAVFANLWLTRPLVLRKLEASPAMNAMIRTTTATTVFESGEKENVLPSHARAVVNFRILPGDSVAGVVERARRVVDDGRVQVRITGGFSAEPSLASSVDSESFRKLERAILSTTPDAVVAPYLVVVATDSRYYAELSRNVLRFLPVRVTSRDLERMHGIDERIATTDYEQAVRLYRNLLLEAAR